MSKEFKRTPTCGENDVDLRVATEPRRAADRLTASVQFHELAQGYRSATPDGAQAAYEKLCAYLEGRDAPGSVGGGFTMETILESWDGCMYDGIDIGAALRIDLAKLDSRSAAPQPVCRTPAGRCYTGGAGLWVLCRNWCD